MPLASDSRTEPRRQPAPAPLRRKRTVPVATPAIRRRTVHILLVFVTLVLIVDALVGEKGLIEMMRARQQYREVAGALSVLKRQNDQMREDARRLVEDPSAIESLAREQFGLIRAGEILFIVKDQSAR